MSRAQRAFGLPRHVHARAQLVLQHGSPPDEQARSSLWVRELPSRTRRRLEGPLVTTLHFPRGRVGLRVQRAALSVGARLRRATS